MLQNAIAQTTFYQILYYDNYYIPQMQRLYKVVYPCDMRNNLMLQDAWDRVHL